MPVLVLLNRKHKILCFWEIASLLLASGRFCLLTGRFRQEYSSLYRKRSGRKRPDPSYEGAVGTQFRRGYSVTGSFTEHLGHQVQTKVPFRRSNRPGHLRHLPASGPGAGRCGAGTSTRLLVRTFCLGVAARRHPGGANHLQCRRRSTQARDVDDQLHRLRHRRRLDERNTGEGPRSRHDAQGRLRDRL